MAYCSASYSRFLVSRPAHVEQLTTVAACSRKGFATRVKNCAVATIFTRCLRCWDTSERSDSGTSFQLLAEYSEWISSIAKIIPSVPLRSVSISRQSVMIWSER
mgnify:CR=1 FL=1